MTKPRPKKMGRRPIYGRAPMKCRITTRLNEEQAAAVSAWCAERGCSVLALLREAVLEIAGLSKLGRGLAPRQGAAKGRGLLGATSIGVPFTDAQYAALRAYAEKRGVEIAALIRESALAKAGAGSLGVLGKNAALRSAITRG